MESAAVSAAQDITMRKHTTPTVQRQQGYGIWSIRAKPILERSDIGSILAEDR